MSIWRWSQWLPPVPADAQISLGEGNTPVVQSRRIGPSLGLPHLYFKLEIGNPTGSYKDRFAASAISHMRQRKTTCIATSSGNTGSALAAYCAAATMTCEIAIVETAPAGKLDQMLAYGAQLYRVKGFGLDSTITQQTFDYLVKKSTAPDAALQISAFKYSPLGMSGVQTISYELAEQIQPPIAHVFCPAGGGGLILALARGFEQMRELNASNQNPRVHCVQPEGNNTIAGPLSNGALHGQAVECRTQISGLQVPSLIDADPAIEICRRSRGMGHLVSDAEVWSAQGRLAREEGIFCEPAGAVALAGVINAIEREMCEPSDHIVCIVTGAGFKDPSAIPRLIADAGCPLYRLSELENQNVSDE